MATENDFETLDDDELTISQLRRRIRKLRATLSEKTEDEKTEEGDEAEKDRGELADLHHENKTKSDSYEDDKEAIAVDAFTNKDEDDKDEKKDKKKSDDKEE
jgi:hypothetical protein